MMEIACEQCGKKYRIDESRFTTRKARFSCKACDHIMIVEKPDLNEDVPDSLADTVENQIPSSQSSAATSDGGQNKVQQEPDKEIPQSSKEAPPADAGGELTDESKSIKWFQSIQFVISALLVILTTVIMAGYAWFNYNDLKHTMNQEITQSSEIIAKRLSKHLVEPFWALDDEIITDLLNSEMMDPQIYAIYIYDRDGRTVYMGKKRNPTWQIVNSQKAIRGPYASVRKPIQKDKEQIGAVEVYLTSKFLKEKFHRSMWRILITAVLLVVILFVSLFLALRKIIIMPIRKLTEAAEKISMGELDQPIELHSKNEIGLLGQAIGRMQTSLRFAMERMKRR